MDGLVKRCFRHQVVHVAIEHGDESVTLIIRDHGLVIEHEKDSSWSEVVSLVEASGGKLLLQSWSLVIFRPCLLAVSQRKIRILGSIN